MTSMPAPLAGIVISLPFIFGIAVNLLIIRLVELRTASRLKGIQIAGQRLLWAGVGGLLGYVAWAAATHTAYAFKLNFFQMKSIIGLGLATCLALGPYLMIGRPNGDVEVRACKQSMPMTKFESTLAALIIFYVGIVTWQVLWIPPQSWDGLTFWMERSVGFLGQNIDIKNAVAGYGAHGHPMTLSYVLSWSSWVSAYTDNLQLQLLPWYLIYLSGLMACVGTSLVVAQCWVISGITGLVFLTIPLLENNALLGGYAGIWVGTSLLMATALQVVCMTQYHNLSKTQLLFHCGAIFCCTISTSLLKNTGLAYAIALYLAILVIWLIAENKRKSLFFALLILSIIATMTSIFWETDINFLGFEMSSESGRPAISFAGKSLSFSDVSISAVLGNMKFAYFYNGSFSVILILVGLSYVSGNPNRSKEVGLVSLLFTILITLLAVFQFTEYGFMHARPNMDTGFSRFSLPAFMIGCLLISLSCRQLKREV